MNITYDLVAKRGKYDNRPNVILYVSDEREEVIRYMKNCAVGMANGPAGKQFLVLHGRMRIILIVHITGLEGMMFDGIQKGKKNERR